MAPKKKSALRVLYSVFVSLPWFLFLYEHKKSSFTKLHITGSSLPLNYRVADRNCKPPEQRASMAAPSSENRVGIPTAKLLSQGGYKQIGAGSGAIHFVGYVAMVLSKMQHSFGIFGTVGEVGVHHGLFTVCLYITARKTEKLVAADIFSQQEKNVDKSGNGDLDRFVDAVSRIGLAKSDLFKIHVGSTTELPFDWHQRDGFEPFRMISVDAGHTSLLTFNDLEVAACNLAKGGIIILDDYFHIHWTGVSEGLYQYFAQGHDRLYPFLVCWGKVFMTNDRAAHKTYYEGLRADEAMGKFMLTDANKFGGSNSFDMHGVNYLLCEQGSATVEEIHELWSSAVY